MGSEMNMAEVSRISAVYFLIVLLLTYVLLKIGQKKYKAMIDPLNKKEFGLKDFFPIGFVLMDLARHQYGTDFDRKLRRQLVELYEPDYTEYYLRVYWGASASYLVFGAMMSGLFWISMGPLGIFAGYAVGGVMAYANFADLNSRLEKRHMKILLDMPDFTNKILILSGAGMTLRAALVKISHEMTNNTPLYQELSGAVKMMENGATDEAALGRLATRCNTPQMRRFTSVVLQNLHRGGSDVINALREIGQEQWAERKAIAMRISQEADTKLLFPMMLMLASVLLMTIVPAVMSIQL